MAKSVSVLLFVVLAVTVSLPDTHRVTAAPSASELAGFFNKYIAKDATTILKNAKSEGEATTEVVIKVHQEGDKNEPSAAGGQGRGSTPLIKKGRILYVGVTDIKVRDDPTLGQNGPSMLAITNDGSGGVFVSTSFPFTILNKKVYGLLKAKISDGNGRTEAKSKLGINVEQPCYKTDKLPSITLVFDGGAEMKVEADKCWYPQGDGSMCLAILQATWSSGETFLGTMLQTGMNVDGDK